MHNFKIGFNLAEHFLKSKRKKKDFILKINRFLRYTGLETHEIWSKNEF